MGWIILIIIILCILGYSDNTTADTTPTVTRRSKDARLSKKEIKRMKKAYRQAEMDAFEDMIMYMEVFSDD